MSKKETKNRKYCNDCYYFDLLRKVPWHKTAYCEYGGNKTVNINWLRPELKTLACNNFRPRTK